jgi:hypothetical protein
MSTEDQELMEALQRASDLYRSWIARLRAGDLVVNRDGVVEKVAGVRVRDNGEPYAIYVAPRNTTTGSTYMADLTFLRPATAQEREALTNRQLQTHLANMLQEDQLFPTDTLRQIEQMVEDSVKKRRK